MSERDEVSFQQGDSKLGCKLHQQWLLNQVSGCCRSNTAVKLPACWCFINNGEKSRHQLGLFGFGPITARSDRLITTKHV